ncbi:MAG: Ig domain-containing protein [Gaiellales bacterium]
MLLAGLVILWFRSVQAAAKEPSKSMVRSWIAIALVLGLLVFCATSFVVGDSALRSTLFGGLVASVGAAVAFYFSSKSADQARADILDAAVKLSQGGAGTAPVAPTKFSAASPPAGTANVAYPGYPFLADGSPAPSYARGTGSLPKGLQIDPDGSLHGTPEEAGSFPFTVVAWNSAGPLVSDQVTLTINPAA